MKRNGMHRNGRHIQQEDIARFKMMSHMAMVRGTHGVLGRNDNYEHRMEWSVPSPSCATACGGNLCGPYLVGETGCSLYVTACVVVLWCYWVCVYLICGACTCCVDVLPRESGADNVWLWSLTIDPYGPFYLAPDLTVYSLHNESRWDVCTRYEA